MLDIVTTYADKWQYQLNANKSSIMVLGESAKTKLSARSSRKWYIGQKEVSETDEQHHLGILRTVITTTIHRTSERCTSARSSFFALISIGSRSGCLHLLTLAVPTSHSFFMVPRSGPFQRLSSTCWSGSIGKSFVLSRVSLRIATHHPLTPCLGVAKKLLIKRIQDPMAKGLIPDLQVMLDHLNLPSISTLLDKPIKPAPWKRSIKKQLGVRAYLQFLEDCQDSFISECDIKIGRPLPHWSVMVGDVQRTRATNFRI